jgi:hypothetical protein
MVTALLWRALAPKGNLLEEGFRHLDPGTVGEEEGWHHGDLEELVREEEAGPHC